MGSHTKACASARQTYFFELLPRQDKTRQNLLFRTLAGAALSEAFSEGIVVNLELGDLQQGYRVSKNILSL